MHISTPLPIPRWNLNDQFSNHRAIKIINHLGHNLTFYDVGAETQSSHLFLHAIPRCFLNSLFWFRHWRYQALALPDLWAETHRAMQFKEFKTGGSTLLRQTNDKCLELCTKNLKGKRLFPFLCLDSNSPPTSLCLANWSSKTQLRSHHPPPILSLWLLYDL